MIPGEDQREEAGRWRQNFLLKLNHPELAATFAHRNVKQLINAAVPEMPLFAAHVTCSTRPPHYNPLTINRLLMKWNTRPTVAASANGRNIVSFFRFDLSTPSFYSVFFIFQIKIVISYDILRLGKDQQDTRLLKIATNLGYPSFL